MSSQWLGQWFRFLNQHNPDGFTPPSNTPTAAASRTSQHLGLGLVEVPLTVFGNGSDDVAA